jgi:hypothetical protein
MADALVSPMALAKELDIRPQVLYGLIRQQRIKEHEMENGKKGIYRDAALRVLDQVRHKRKRDPETGELDGDPESTRSPLQPGQSVSWATVGSRNGQGVQFYRRVATVAETNEHFTVFRDCKNKIVQYRNTSVVQLLRDGTMMMEDPTELIEAAVIAFRASDQNEKADRIEAMLAEIRN